MIENRTEQNRTEQVSLHGVNWEFIGVFLLFAISVAIRFKIADFPKIVFVQSDEFRYYLLAKSFSQGLGMSINGYPTFYQKIFYSLCITPTFWCENIILTLTSIAFINSFLISSGIFPLYIITKKILSEKKHIYFVLLIYVFFSDLSYSMTFMSEVVFLPLGLWLLLIFYNIISFDENNKRKYFVWCLFAGILTYILYLTKEISLVFILTYAGFIIFDLIKNKNFKSVKVFGFVIFFFSFLFLFLLFKLTLFAGSGNSYNQQSFDVLLKPGRFGFMIYSFFYYIGMTIFSLLFFPLVLPILNFKKFNNIDKKFFLFLCSLLILSAGVVAYTISVREDFGNPTIRFHARYITYIYLPFIVYFLKCFEFKYEKYKFNFISVFVVLLCIFSIFIIQANSLGIYVDNTIMFYLFHFACKSNFNLFNFKIIVFIFMIISIILYIKYFKLVKYIIYCFLLLLMIYNNIYFTKIVYELVHLYQYKIDYTYEITNFISLNRDKKFLYINNNNDVSNINEKMFYTYINTSNINYLYDYAFYNSKNKDFEYDYKNRDFDYIISSNRFPTSSPTEDFYVYIKNFGFTIYKLKNKKIKGLYNKFEASIMGLNLFFRNKDEYDEYNYFLNIHPNGFLFGPYIKLTTGKYEVEFVLKSNSQSELSITSDCGKNIIKKLTTNKNNEKVVFDLNTDTENVEFLIRNIGKRDLIVKDIILRRI